MLRDSSWRLPIGALMAPGFALAGMGVIAAERNMAGLTPAIANAAPLLTGIVWVALAWWGQRLVARLGLHRIAHLGNVAGVIGAAALATSGPVGYVAAMVGLSAWSATGALLTPVYISRLAGTPRRRAQWLQWVNAISIGTAMATPLLLGAAFNAEMLAPVTMAAVVLISLLCWPDRHLTVTTTKARRAFSMGGWLLVVTVVGLEMVVTFWAATWMASRGFGATPGDVSWAVSAYFAGMLISRLFVPLAVPDQAPSRAYFYSFIAFYAASLGLVATGSLGVTAFGLFLVGIGVGPLYPFAVDRLLASIENPVEASATGVAASATAIGGGPGVLGAIGAALGIGPASVAVIPVLLVATTITVHQVAAPAAPRPPTGEAG